MIFFTGVLWPSEHLPSPPMQTNSVIQDVSVIDVKTRSVLRNTSVLIEDGIIRKISENGSIKIRDGTAVINAKDRFLIPGLWDMHVHTVQFSSRLHYPLMIAYGITGFRDMGLSSAASSDPFFTHMLDKNIRNKHVLEGKYPGPLMMSVASHVLETSEDLEIYWTGNDRSEIEDKVRKFLEESSRQGADFIKIQLEGADSEEIFNSLKEHAHNYTLPLSGHMPAEVLAGDALTHMNSLEHARALLYGSYKHSNTVNLGEFSPDDFDTPGLFLDEIVSGYDSSKAIKLLSNMKNHQTAYCPTHVTRRWEAYLDDPDYLIDERLDYVPWIQEKMWNIDRSMMLDIDNTRQGRKAFKEFYLMGLDVTGLAHQKGVRILTGTDALDSYVFYGSSVHDELEEMVKAGLSPAEALKTATLNAAIHLDLEEEYGSIEVGKKADLIILNKNPLDNIEYTRDISAVIQNGRLYNSENIRELKEFAKRQASSFSLNCKMIWKLLLSLLL